VTAGWCALLLSTAGFAAAVSIGGIAAWMPGTAAIVCFALFVLGLLHALASRRVTGVRAAFWGLIVLGVLAAGAYVVARETGPRVGSYVFRSRSTFLGTIERGPEALARDPLTPKTVRWLESVTGDDHVTPRLVLRGDGTRLHLMLSGGVGRAQAAAWERAVQDAVRAGLGDDFRPAALPDEPPAWFERRLEGNPCPR
jgi:hypothetical protein